MSETEFLQRQRSYSAGFAVPVTAQRIMPVIMSVFVAVLCLALIFFSAASVFAVEDNGADAHARSMSMGSGEDPVPDEATTLDYGQSDEITDEEVQTEEEAEADDEEMSEEANDAEGEDTGDTENTAEADDLSGRATTFLIAAVLIAAAALAAILIIRSRNRNTISKKKRM